MPYTITENCTGCTACMKRCPTDAITGERKLLHVIDPELCIDCGACGVVCPDEAIYASGGRVWLGDGPSAGFTFTRNPGSDCQRSAQKPSACLMPRSV